MTKIVTTVWTGGEHKNYGPFAADGDAASFSVAVRKLKPEIWEVKDLADWGIDEARAVDLLINPGPIDAWPTEIEDWPAFLAGLN